jgi:hypothetical protein
VVASLPSEPNPLTPFPVKEGGTEKVGSLDAELEPVPASLREAVRGRCAKRAFARFGQDDRRRFGTGTTLYCAIGSVICSFRLNYPEGLRTRESEMTTSMSIQRVVLTHQKDMVFHANAIFLGSITHNPR